MTSPSARQHHATHASLTLYDLDNGRYVSFWFWIDLGALVPSALDYLQASDFRRGAPDLGARPLPFTSRQARPLALMHGAALLPPPQQHAQHDMMTHDNTFQHMATPDNMQQQTSEPSSGGPCSHKPRHKLDWSNRASPVVRQPGTALANPSRRAPCEAHPPGQVPTCAAPHQSEAAAQLSCTRLPVAVIADCRAERATANGPSQAWPHE
jgi:hypothetical protein